MTTTGRQHIASRFRIASSVFRRYKQSEGTELRHKVFRSIPILLPFMSLKRFPCHSCELFVTGSGYWLGGRSHGRTCHAKATGGLHSVFRKTPLQAGYPWMCGLSLDGKREIGGVVTLPLVCVLKTQDSRKQDRRICAFGSHCERDVVHVGECGAICGFSISFPTLRGGQVDSEVWCLAVAALPNTSLSSAEHRKAQIRNYDKKAIAREGVTPGRVRVLLLALSRELLRRKALLLLFCVYIKMEELTIFHHRQEK